MKTKIKSINSALRNIERYYEKEISVSERMSYNYCEIADYVVSKIAKNVGIKGYFLRDFSVRDYLPPKINEPYSGGEIVDENLNLCLGKLETADGAYIADFSLHLTASLKADGKIKPTPALFSEYGDKIERGGRVAFAESKLLTAAYNEFVKKDKNFSASYVRSFSDACEEVVDGNAEYCILPIENSREGAILTVYRLIEQHELFVARECSVDNDGITTKFALLCSRHRGIMETIGRQKLLLRLSGCDSKMWAKIFTGATVLSVETLKNISLPLGYTDGYAHLCTFSGSGETLFAMLLFLTMLRVDFTIMGVYE